MRKLIKIDKNDKKHQKTSKKGLILKRISKNSDFLSFFEFFVQNAL